MNEEDDLLESELRSVALRPPSRALEERIAAELAPAPARKTSPARFGFSKPTLILTPLATAAAFTLLLLKLTPDELRPVSIANSLYDTENEGIVTLEDGQPAQRVRLLYIDTITWANVRGGASLQMSRPREEIQLLPLTYH
jgi:hypothetical protein